MSKRKHSGSSTKCSLHLIIKQNVDKMLNFFYNGMTRVWLPLATTSAPAPAPQKQKIILGIGENQIQNNIDILMQCGVMENIG